MVLKLETSAAKWLKLKVRTFLGLIPTFVEVKWEKVVVGLGLKCFLQVATLLKEESPAVITLKFFRMFFFSEQFICEFGHIY